MNKHVLGLFCFISFAVSSTIAQIKGPALEIGVSRSLAEYRKALISDINYSLKFDVPESKSEPIEVGESLHFKLKSNQFPLQLDFKADQSKLKSLIINGAVAAINHQKEHLIIDPKYLIEGKNVIDIKFEAGEAALNRNMDYLYTLFVPDRARTVFPCFDQPDLKATYKLSLIVPAGWKAIANAALGDSTVISGEKTYNFQTSDTISTYLFAFAAGKFASTSGKVGRMNSSFLYRETDPVKISRSIPEIFYLHSKSLRFFEQWTGIPYPFQKFGFVAIPDFQFGGMEHPGAVSYKASTLFLDDGATKDQLNSRYNLIAHETAHMWFGDLVTMNWFNDVWMKEVFANFMADKSSKNTEDTAMYNLKFLIDHFPAAYAVDRTPGSNPIRQQLDNLNEAGSMYGNIIYHKAPIMMQQLERLMGEEGFKTGVQEYLRKFSNSNASWPDLIAILTKHTKVDLEAWNKVWVNESGRPIVEYEMAVKNERIAKILLRQRAEYGIQRLWPQYFEISLFYKNRTIKIPVNLNTAEMEVPDVVGMERPLFILFNSCGQGYGLWPIDRQMPAKLYEMDQSLHRATAYISLYENMLNKRTIGPEELIALFIKGFGKETEELNLKLICGYINSIYWQYISDKERNRIASRLEFALWSALERQSQHNMKKILFKTYQDIHLSVRSQSKLYAIWKNQNAPEGLKLTEDDYTSLSFALALRDYPDANMLNEQFNRITNEDRKKRFQFIIPSLSSSSKARDSFFNSLELKANRERESNVLAALHYLHHPLRQATSIEYLSKSLSMLEEIQVTGDIFFPQSWLQSTLGSYSSKAAADVVSNFLLKHPNYSPKLKAKIEQAADNLYRSSTASSR